MSILFGRRRIAHRRRIAAHRAISHTRLVRRGLSGVGQTHEVRRVAVRDSVYYAISYSDKRTVDSAIFQRSVNRVHVRGVVQGGHADTSTPIERAVLDLVRMRPNCIYNERSSTTLGI